MESLPTFHRKAQGWIRQIKERFWEKDYAITEFWTGAILHGAAQRRIRYHLIAHKVRLHFPELDMDGPFTFRDAMRKWRIPSESRKQQKDRYQVLSKEGKISRILPHVPPGGSCRQVWAQVYNVNHNLPGIPWRRCHWDRPSTAMTGAIRQIHPRYDRVLTVGECMALCGYPQDYWLPESNSQAYASIGKGVLPPVGRYLARMARLSLIAGNTDLRSYDEITDFRPNVNAIMRTFPKVGLKRALR